MFAICSYSCATEYPSIQMVMAAHISRAPDLQITNRQQWISFAEDKKSEERERERERLKGFEGEGEISSPTQFIDFFFLLNRKPV